MSVKCNQGGGIKCPNEAVYFCMYHDDIVEDSIFLSCERCEQEYLDTGGRQHVHKYIYFPTYEALQVELIKRQL